MGFRSVFRSLQEVFPQVDLRILKAVAIEHSKDVDTAVEFILSEVLPSITMPLEASLTLSDMREVKYASDEAESNRLGFSSPHGVEESNASLFSQPRHPVENFPDADHRSAALHVKPPHREEAVGDGLEVEHVVELEKCFLSGHQEIFKETSASTPCEPTAVACENAFATDTTNDTSTVPCFYEPVDGFSSSMHCGDDNVQSCLHAKTEEVLSLEKRNLESLLGFSAALSSIEHEDSIIDSIVPLHADIQDLYGLIMPSAVCTTFQNIAAPSLEKNMDSVQLGVPAGMEINICNACDEESSCPMENGVEQLVFDDKNHTTTIATRSGQVVSIDLLEDFVNDAKSNKTALVSAMESVVDMMKEVDIHEKEAIQAKEEASKAGLDILVKVDDLKEMLKHANQANDMHAGEVYAEKSILETEARELQSRLLNLSDERDNSLSIIEEMRQTLKARLAAAEAERLDAEQDKREKEEMARKAHTEQELIMDKVVQESKKLQQEAEENSKLGEFLMDRGRMVDILQGEIAVICEDVLALKERVDGRVLLSKSLSSIQATSSSASSSSSRLNTLSDGVPGPVDSSEIPITTSQELSKSQQPEGVEKSIAVGGDRKVSSDDDWEYFDGEAEFYAHVRDIITID